MKISAADLEDRFDRGEDVSEYFDGPYRLPMAEPHTMSVTFPRWVILVIGQEADRLGVTPESLVKAWIAEHVDQLPNTRTLNQSAMDPIDWDVLSGTRWRHGEGLRLSAQDLL